MRPDGQRTNREKTKVIASFWAKNKDKYKLNVLLKKYDLKRSTYYDELKRINKPDKYKKVKNDILNIFHNSHETYGYRRIWCELIKLGYSYCPDTIRSLTGKLGIKVHLYSKHMRKYSSYKGNIGRIAPNVLKQKFVEMRPYHVLHTDITQIKLTNGKFGYISAVTDEASKEVLSMKVSDSPNMLLIMDTFKKLKYKLPNGSKAIVHSDQGFQYQLGQYRRILKKMGLIQSLSRKGNCHDNAPIESMFNLLKREFLNHIKINNINELKQNVNKYVHWFNHERISLNRKGLTPIEYRNQSLEIS